MMPFRIWSTMMILSDGTPYFVALAYWSISSAWMHSTQQAKSLSFDTAFFWRSSKFSPVHFFHFPAFAAMAESSVGTPFVMASHAFCLP